MRWQTVEKREQTVAAPKVTAWWEPQVLKQRKTQQRELLKYANTLLEHINANTLKRSWDEPCEPALEQVTADQGKRTLSSWRLTLLNII